MRSLWSYSISEMWSYPTGFESRDCDLPAWASCFCLRSLLKTTWSSLKITIIESKKINTKTVMAQRGAFTTSLITYTQEIYTQWPLYWVQLYKWRQPKAIQKFCSIIFIFKATLLDLSVYIEHWTFHIWRPIGNSCSDQVVAACSKSGSGWPLLDCKVIWTGLAVITLRHIGKGL